MSSPRRCPQCRKPATKEYQPFCSQRCADLDLGNWLDGRYMIPGKDGEALLNPDEED